MSASTAPATPTTAVIDVDQLDDVDARTCRYPGCQRPPASRVHLYCDDLGHTSALARQARERRTGQSALAEAVTTSLARSGKWEQWQQTQPALARFASLEATYEAWRRRDDDCYPVVGALTALGSRRGGDDDDAALAVLVLLSEGVNRVAGQLSDLCEVGDVHATVWEEIKRAEPQLGNRAGRYLLRRAHQRLCRQSGRRRRGDDVAVVSKFRTISLEAWLEAAGADYGDHPEDRDQDYEIGLAVPAVEDSVEDLTDLLTWARDVGVIATEEIDLLIELIAAEHEVLARGENKRVREEAQRIVGERHGVTMRQIRRRRDRTAARLRDAAPQYLAATA